MANITNNTTNLQAVLEALQGKAAGGGGEQATPVISVNNANGLITATAGTKSSTYQMAFQAAQTITPGTTNKTIPANTYLGGVQTIEGDANLVASNIKKGTSIFGVTGTLEEGSGGGSGELVDYSENEDAMVTGTLSVYMNDRVELIRSSAFYYCSSLTSVNFPACKSIGNSAFYYCRSLTSVNFPACTSIGDYAFYCCSSLTSVNFPACKSIGASAFYDCRSLTSLNFPACTSIGSYAFVWCSSLTSINFPACKSIGASAFRYCDNLTSVNFPACTSIDSSAFYNCSKLTRIDLGASIVCTLSNSNAFLRTGITSTTGAICVPGSLVTAYKTATNWTYFANIIIAITHSGGSDD